MNKDITLVILAGGMGSRFGGLKQIEPMGPNGEFIIDYSIYDAIKAGFNKVVFLIKRENFDLFKETIGRRVESHIKVEYAFQELDSVACNIEIPNDRVKPLGTGHAILCTRNLINEPFAMINADDFYGRDAFIKAYNYLNSVDILSNNYGLIGYKVSNTLTENGSVKRGVCETNVDNYLVKITESSVKKNGEIITAIPLNGSDSFIVGKDDIVSMNFLLFTPTIFNHLEVRFPIFLEKNKDSLLTSEFLIPDVLQDLINDNTCNTRVIGTSANWYGVTYREDVPSVRASIKNLIEEGEYNYHLWD